MNFSSIPAAGAHHQASNCFVSAFSMTPGIVFVAVSVQFSSSDDTNRLNPSETDVGRLRQLRGVTRNLSLAI